MQLFTYVRQCLAAEMRLVQSISGEIMTGLPNLTISNSGAEILQKIQILSAKTQVSNVKVFYFSMYPLK